MAPVKELPDLLMSQASYSTEVSEGGRFPPLSMTYRCQHAVLTLSPPLHPSHTPWLRGRLIDR